MMKDNDILEMIKNHDSQNALKEMEELFKSILIDKLNKNSEIDASEKTFMQVLECCIKKFPEDYEILTYLRNIYFFDDKADEEKLYELAYIYENLMQE